MTFLVATSSLPAVYRPNGYARTTTAGTPHARANIGSPKAKDYSPPPHTATHSPNLIQSPKRFQAEQNTPNLSLVEIFDSFVSLLQNRCPSVIISLLAYLWIHEFH